MTKNITKNTQAAPHYASSVKDGGTHNGPLASTGAVGVGAGAAIGLLGGLPGVIAGAVVGGIIGAVAGEAVIQKLEVDNDITP